ncbi:MAG: DUF2961 domain-containing protein [Anaerolineaceae bacterium]|nr:DUF2961 domain-containing protein [Anaerolineaceae bacterium]
MAFNGLVTGMSDLVRLSDARTRSISAENPDGARGRGDLATDGTGAQAARDLGQGWKVSPSIRIAAGERVTLADIAGPGALQHIWFAVSHGSWRQMVLRFYWDGEETPSIEVPFGDFFCNGWNVHCTISSLAIAVNPVAGFNSYWQMPFRQRARVTLENIAEETFTCYYQITWTETDIAEDAAYLHAQWRRSNPLPYGEVHTLVDGVQGQGHYVGTCMAWGSNNNGWWGEGEIKFYMDGDEHPTICGTGTEDYFGGAWAFRMPNGNYGEFSSPYSGMPQVLRPDGFELSQMRFGLYRWHILDPVRFQQDLRVTIQALGWRSGGRYLPLQDDIASVAWWYQAEPHAAYPQLPDADGLEVI